MTNYLSGIQCEPVWIVCASSWIPAAGWSNLLLLYFRHKPLVHHKSPLPHIISTDIIVHFRKVGVCARTDGIALVKSFRLNGSASYVGGFDILSSSLVVVFLPNMMIIMFKIDWWEIRQKPRGFTLMTAHHRDRYEYLSRQYSQAVASLYLRSLSYRSLTVVFHSSRLQIYA